MLSTPPAFNLSQNQTLQLKSFFRTQALKPELIELKARFPNSLFTCQRTIPCPAPLRAALFSSGEKRLCTHQPTLSNTFFNFFSIFSSLFFFLHFYHTVIIATFFMPPLLGSFGQGGGREAYAQKEGGKGRKTSPVFLSRLPFRPFRDNLEAPEHGMPYRHAARLRLCRAVSGSLNMSFRFKPTGE